MVSMPETLLCTLMPRTTSVANSGYSFPGAAISNAHKEAASDARICSVSRGGKPQGEGCGGAGLSGGSREPSACSWVPLGL